MLLGAPPLEMNRYEQMKQVYAYSLCFTRDKPGSGVRLGTPWGRPEGGAAIGPGTNWGERVKGSE